MVRLNAAHSSLLPDPDRLKLIHRGQILARESRLTENPAEAPTKITVMLVDDGSSRGLTLTMRCVNGAVVTAFPVAPEATVAEVKAQAVCAFRCFFRLDDAALAGEHVLFAGARGLLLDDSRRLSSYNLAPDSLVYVLPSLLSTPPLTPAAREAGFSAALAASAQHQQLVAHAAHAAHALKQLSSAEHGALGGLAAAFGLGLQPLGGAGAEACSEAGPADEELPLFTQALLHAPDALRPSSHGAPLAPPSSAQRQSPVAPAGPFRAEQQRAGGVPGVPAVIRTGLRAPPVSSPRPSLSSVALLRARELPSDAGAARAGDPLGEAAAALAASATATLLAAQSLQPAASSQQPAARGLPAGLHAAPLSGLAQLVGGVAAPCGPSEQSAEEVYYSKTVQWIESVFSQPPRTPHRLSPAHPHQQPPALARIDTKATAVAAAAAVAAGRGAAAPASPPATSVRGLKKGFLNAPAASKRRRPRAPAADAACGQGAPPARLDAPPTQQPMHQPAQGKPAPLAAAESTAAAARPKRALDETTDKVARGGACSGVCECGGCNGLRSSKVQAVAATASCGGPGVAVRGAAASLCALCERKLPLIAAITARCKCGSLFCAAHVHPAQHACCHDHKKEAQLRIAAEIGRSGAPRNADGMARSAR